MTADTQPTFFEVPEAARLRRPPNSAASGLPVKYLAYAGRAHCEDCDSIVYQDLMAGRTAPSIRRARKRRVQGGTTRLLCAEHAELQRQADRGAPAGDAT
jgi:hypothetical protein